MGQYAVIPLNENQSKLLEFHKKKLILAVYILYQGFQRLACGRLQSVPIFTHFNYIYLLLTHSTHSSPLFDIPKPYHNLFYTFSRFSTYSQPTPPIFTYSYFFLTLFTRPWSPFCILNPHSLSQALPQLLPTPLAHFRVFFIFLLITSHFHCF